MNDTHDLDHYRTIAATAFTDSERAAVYRAIWPITQIEGKTLLLSIHDTATRGIVRSALDAGESVEAIFRMHGIDY